MIAIYAMKKIMFDDKYGLTKAVLEGRKTMTRRIVEEMAGRKYKKLPQIQEDCNDGSFLVFKDADDLEPIILYPKYKVGEVVAVAQNYKDAGLDPKNCDKFQLVIYGDFPSRYNHGWTNKMFVKADLMPHQIRITNIKVERLQDISDEDCLNEGVFLGQFHTYSYVGRPRCPFNTPRDAFASLIDRISGKGTWEENPWVFVYVFELVK